MFKTFNKIFTSIKQTVVNFSSKYIFKTSSVPRMSPHQFFQEFEKIQLTHSKNVDFWNSYIKLLEDYYGTALDEGVFRENYMVFQSELEKAELDYLKSSNSAFSKPSKKP